MKKNIWSYIKLVFRVCVWLLMIVWFSYYQLFHAAIDCEESFIEKYSELLCSGVGRLLNISLLVFAAWDYLLKHNFTLTKCPLFVAVFSFACIFLIGPFVSFATLGYWEDWNLHLHTRFNFGYLFHICFLAGLFYFRLNSEKDASIIYIEEFNKKK